MRAIIKCRSDVEPKGLDGLLMDSGWWPSLDQNHEELIKRKDDILSHVAPEDLVIVRETYLYTIYDDATKSWGIVSNPSKHLINFRIKNPDSDRLKAGCQRLVSDLQRVGGSKKHGESGSVFDFVSTIEVLEPNSTDHAYSGEVLPASRLGYAIRQKRTETWVGILAAVSASIFLMLTIPPIATAFYGNLNAEWFTFTKGFFDRLATSAIVTATVSLLNVILHWFDLRRKPIVIWSV